MKKYIPLIIIEGATVMAVELCGAKLMAPLYGGSLFVWAAILAITLAALAFGYFYGGILSSKEKPVTKLYYVVSVSAVFIALMPFIAQ
ncbi:MAG: SAM-dependent methyltransferase, partial [Bacteroidia bacterium]|nr:SAM-dependent methyltransferase [Bacteroidia bacterium]